ncbi:MAG: 50S ribosomal protein L10, partial [Ignavibacteriales bacterium]|nr:50S ribosomal protein L10 [Ignavibacteriales bacterium]
EVNSLRRECFKAGVKYTVAKNTLIARAMEGMSFSDSLKTHLAGPTAIAMGYDDAVAPAKILKKFSDKTNKLPVKAFMFENQVFDGKQFARIAALPPKPEVVASILGSLQSPIASIVYFLDALEKKLQPSAA